MEIKKEHFCHILDTDNYCLNCSEKVADEIVKTFDKNREMKRLLNQLVALCEGNMIFADAYRPIKRAKEIIG